ncbi:MAG: four helix bundle protein [Candidatus Moranbacteria bacterium RIFCSPHIGHO2_12_FULL_54_9]|nr:MAG: four helix bundle protein [Candidatus Moranbacteria bacterium RIFCSPHIGHO2_01_FULL_54_31]OGI25713.1 MAG: four helix bundle protein [Candidatus Moranbacteria bacterium RIFCSPHIGHO2_12_FULL_54_9]
MLEVKKKVYDLEERTAKFSENIIQLIKKIPKNDITKPIINQLIRSGTSIGANYCEADCAESRKDFEHKIGICKKEAKETRYWIRVMAEASPEMKEALKVLWKETNELHLIFIAIVKKSRSKN